MSAHPATRTRTRTRKPANETRRGNYILRSKNTKSMLRVLALASEGRVRGADTPGYVGASLRKSDGFWAGNCTAEIRSLLRQCLVYRAAGCKANGYRTYYYLTSAGWYALYGALRVAGLTRNAPALFTQELDASVIE